MSPDDEQRAAEARMERHAKDYEEALKREARLEEKRMIEAEQETIPAAVRRYAEKWRDHMLQRKTDNWVDPPQLAKRSPLESYVNEYLDKVFSKMLDTFMGIDRSYSDVRVKDSSPNSVVNQLAAEFMPALLQRGRELFQIDKIVLTPEEQRKLKHSFRQSLVRKLENELCDLAQKRAKAMAEDLLNSYMSDPEWIAVMEGKITPAKKPDEQ